MKNSVVIALVLSVAALLLPSCSGKKTADTASAAVEPAKQKTPEEIVAAYNLVKPEGPEVEVPADFDPADGSKGILAQLVSGHRLKAILELYPKAEAEDPSTSPFLEAARQRDYDLMLALDELGFAATIQELQKEYGGPARETYRLACEADDPELFSFLDGRIQPLALLDKEDYLGIFRLIVDYDAMKVLAYLVGKASTEDFVRSLDDVGSGRREASDRYDGYEMSLGTERHSQSDYDYVALSGSLRMNEYLAPLCGLQTRVFVSYTTRTDGAGPSEEYPGAAAAPRFSGEAHSVMDSVKSRGNSELIALYEGLGFLTLAEVVEKRMPIAWGTEYDPEYGGYVIDRHEGVAYLLLDENASVKYVEERGGE